MRGYYASLLSRAGCTVDQAANGYEAVEKALQATFDLFLVDVNMPKMPGYELIRQLRQQETGMRVPVVIISTEGRENEQEEGFLAGANVFLVKPVPPEKLIVLARMATGRPCFQSGGGRYEVSLEVEASAEEPNLLAIFERMTRLGEIEAAEIKETPPATLTLVFYLASTLGPDALRAGILAGSEENLRLTVGRSPEAEEVNAGVEAEVLRLVLTQQRRYLEGGGGDFTQRALSAVRILGNVGAYLNRPEVREEAERLLAAPAPDSSWREGVLSLLNAIEKQAILEAGAGRPRGGRPVSGGARGKSIRVEETKVDRLLALAGELVVACNALPYVVRKMAGQTDHAEITREVRELHTGLERLVRELQDAVMSMRLLPASFIFQKFPRMIRDLARELGKKVELRLEGEETEIDKAVMQAIGEPMVHLVRNAVDHGLEFPEERVKQGKPAEGTLVLRALREGSRVVLEVEDDGRGIDVERVREKGLAAGLISAEEAPLLTEEQVLDLLFVSGFSTSDQVTLVSGRGVGMDAVRSVVQSLGGSVRVSSSPGAGTRVRLELPLTLATSRVLVVGAGGGRYGLPLADVREMVKVSQAELNSVGGRKVTVLRGGMVPVVFLDEVLGLAPKGRSERELCLVVMGAGYALAVDGFEGQEEIVLKPLPGDLGFDSCCAGAAILGDGGVLLVLDPRRMYQRTSRIDIERVEANGSK